MNTWDKAMRRRMSVIRWRYNWMNNKAKRENYRRWAVFTVL